MPFFKFDFYVLCNLGHVVMLDENTIGIEDPNSALCFSDNLAIYVSISK